MLGGLPRSTFSLCVCVLGIQEFRNSGTQQSRTPGIQESRNSGIQEFRSSGIQEFRSSGIQESRNPGFQEFRNLGIQEFRNPGILSIVRSVPKKARQLSGKIDLIDLFFQGINRVDLFSEVTCIVPMEPWAVT